MKITNLSRTLKEYDGTDIVVPDFDENTGERKEQGKVITLRTSLIACLNNNTDKKKLTLEQSLRYYDLSIEIMKNEEVDLKTEDIVFIKNKMIELVYPPKLIGQIVAIIDPQSS